MTLPSLMIAPSIWMQKTFFQYVENERGSRLGLPPAQHRDKYDASIRVAAVLMPFSNSPTPTVLLSDLAPAVIRWLTDSDLARKSLNQVEQRYYAWRTFLPGTIFNQMTENLSNYDRAFDITSAEFSEGCSNSFDKMY